MQRIKWVDERLRCWATWRLCGSSAGYRSLNFEYEERSTSLLSALDIDVETERDALVMDRAVAALIEDLRRVVIAYYLWEGGMSVLEAKLGVTRATVHRRLCHADLRLMQWLDDKAEMRRRYEKSFASYTN